MLVKLIYKNGETEYKEVDKETPVYHPPKGLTAKELRDTRVELNNVKTQTFEKIGEMKDGLQAIPIMKEIWNGITK